MPSRSPTTNWILAARPQPFPHTHPLATSSQLTSVVLDMNGSMGYLHHLVEVLGPEGEQVGGPLPMRPPGGPPSLLRP